MNSVQILDRNELYGIIWVEDYFVHVGSTLINLLVKVKLLASYITDFVRTDTQSVTWTWFTSDYVKLFHHNLSLSFY